MKCFQDGSTTRYYTIWLVALFVLFEIIAIIVFLPADYLQNFLKQLNIATLITSNYVELFTYNTQSTSSSSVILHNNSLCSKMDPIENINS